MHRPSTEPAFWRAVLAAAVKPKVKILDYVPNARQPPERSLEVDSAWKGIESILADVIERFGLQRGRCLEFGVEYGYSTVALSSFFDSVTGIDLFLGDEHTLNKNDIYETTCHRLACYGNIRLHRSDYREWIREDNEIYDLVHVDIVHTYSDTFACGLWSARHSKCTLFHDTERFPAVRRAVSDVARETGKTFYNFKESNGLGILA